MPAHDIGDVHLAVNTGQAAVRIDDSRTVVILPLTSFLENGKNDDDTI